MAVLVEGQKFGLSSKSEPSKSVVYVKLTDSALKSLEDYLKHRAAVEKNGSGGPTIQFTPNGGSISLPLGGDRGPVTYGFGLSANEDGGANKQSSTACLRSTNNTLESLGTMGETMRVKASEDVYKRIGQRFNAVKLENEKNKTVLLDNKDKRKASVPKSSVVRKPVSQPIPPAASSGRERTSSCAISGSTYSGLGPGRGGPRSQSPATGANGRPMPPTGRPVPSPNRQAGGQTSQGGGGDERRREKFLQTHGHKSSKPPPTHNLEIMKKTLRERLIHLLAVRPYKKPELILRINKDGIKEKEKKNISLLLREVAECKMNVYELKRTMWNDVHEDWSFYTESDKVALKRRKPQNLTPPGSDTGSTSSGHSPSSTNPASPPQITNPLKRHGCYDPPPTSSYEPSPKKNRVSNYKRPGGSDSWSMGMSKSPGGLVSGVSPRLSTSISGLQHNSVSPRLDLPYDSVPDDSTPDWGQFHDGEPETAASRNRSPDRQVQQEVKEDPVRHLSSPEVENSPAGGSRASDNEQELDQNHTPSQLMQLLQNENTDFLESYVPIENSEQRIRYKTEFNQYYAKYRSLHNVLDTVSKKFASLENRLREARGSQEIKAVKAQIVVEYDRNKNDKTYQEARSSFQYLHEKLAHIKKLVHDYDTSNLATPGGR